MLRTKDGKRDFLLRFNLLHKSFVIKWDGTSIHTAKNVS